MDVGIIKVGPGNARDRHYYTREMLERDGKVFEGLTMHTVDHREDQRSEGMDVSTVTKVFGVRELDGGEYLMGRVVAYDPDFCEKTRNRAAAGLLGKLQCSILAKGEAQAAEIDGEEYNVVKGITEGRFVDWVTRAGAGGHAHALAESEPEAEPEKTEPAEAEPEEAAAPVAVTLSEDAEPQEEVIQSLAVGDVLAKLGETNLPAASVASIALAEYHDLSEVDSAVAAEVARLKAAGSGQPFGSPKPSEPRKPSRAEILQYQNEVNHKRLGGH